MMEMRLPAALVFVFASALSAQPRIDNVLERMVPPGATSLVGGHMDQIKQTEIYKKLLATQNLSQLDEFARDTGFDPRRDVRELLYTTGPQGSVMLARGTFRLTSTTLKNMKKTRHGQYDIWDLDGNGFCILDSTLAAAGDIPAVEAALDEWNWGITLPLSLSSPAWPESTRRASSGGFRSAPEISWPTIRPPPIPASISRRSSAASTTTGSRRISAPACGPKCMERRVRKRMQSASAIPFEGWSAWVA